MAIFTIQQPVPIDLLQTQGILWNLKSFSELNESIHISTSKPKSKDRISSLGIVNFIHKEKSNKMQ